jgi:hypothetical protein
MEKRKASFEHRYRPGDLPVEELVKQANLRRAEGWDIHFKFTCAWCGERCTLEHTNHLYPEGECFQCGKTTIIDVGGFAMTLSTNAPEKALKTLLNPKKGEPREDS